MTNLSREGFSPNLGARNARGGRWRAALMAATALSVLFLVALVASVVNQGFGYVLTTAEVDPAGLERDGVPLERQDAAALASVVEENVSRRLYRKLDAERPFAERSRDELLELVVAEVVRPTVRETWSLAQSVFGARAIRDYAAATYPDGDLTFRSWVNAGLLSRPQSSVASEAGIRGALIGSLSTLLLAMLVAFPLGIGAAIYLEEYAGDNLLNRVIATNIYNLAGVPSIIYGMLGLAIFVRAMEPLTSGALFGAVAEGGGNGRTILSASLTLALLALPVIIINSQEALRAVPASLRQASLALGATKWRTIWNHVLPASADRILTGTVLAVSRALGETAPLVVVGASTFLSRDPTGPFSKFTTLPIQIYQWTSRPQGEFRNLAAAAILVLLALGLCLNAAVIALRSRYRRERRLGI